MRLLGILLADGPVLDVQRHHGWLSYRDECCSGRQLGHFSWFWRRILQSYRHEFPETARHQRTTCNEGHELNGQLSRRRYRLY